MEGRRAPAGGDQFATNLRETSEGKEKRLTWEGGGEALIVQTSYGKAANIDQICEDLAHIPVEVFRNGEFQQLRANTWMRYMTAMESVTGCPLHGEASTYTVFSCKTAGNVCTIFDLTIQSIMNPICNVPLNIGVAIEQEIMEVPRRFRRPREVTFGYSITFDLEDISAYHGGLVYEIRRAGGTERDVLTIPVTREMLERRKIYIKSGKVKPRVYSTMEGLCVNMAGRS